MFAGLGSERSAQLVPQARLTGPMPWVIAIMIALTTIAAAGGLALANLANAARAELSGGLTVQIVEAGSAERDRQAEFAVALLSNVEGVDAVHRVPDDELEALIEPWFGNSGAVSDAVPVPALIDVRLAGPVTERRLTAIRELLHSRAPAAQIDAQAS